MASRAARIKKNNNAALVRERESGFPFSRFIETRRRRRTTGGREYYWANEGRDERVAREIRDERGA